MTTAETEQPTMEQLRRVRDQIRRDELQKTLLIEKIALLDARNLGFPTLADADVPEIHRQFARDVVRAIVELRD